MILVDCVVFFIIICKLVTIADHPFTKKEADKKQVLKLQYQKWNYGFYN